jgi:transposase InsO family protein
MLGRATRGVAALYSAGETGAELVYRELQMKVSDECLNEHWFLTLQKAQLVIGAWGQEYNEERPHSAIGNLTPMELINHHHNQPQTAVESTSLAVCNH